MVGRKFFASLVMLVALASIGAAQTASKECPVTTYGLQPRGPIDKTQKVTIETTYFTTDDPNIFMSEKTGISRSSAFMKMRTNDFVAKVEKLENQGLARIKGLQTLNSFMGEMAKSNLESAGNNFARLNHPKLSPTDPNYILQLDRQTEISVYETRFGGDARYRVYLLSSFIDVKGSVASKTVDLDAGVFLSPGQTAVFKLTGDGETSRTGTGRSYVAITMRSVDSAR